jgi:hypothetical protein
VFKKAIKSTPKKKKKQEKKIHPKPFPKIWHHVKIGWSTFSGAKNWAEKGYVFRHWAACQISIFGQIEEHFGQSSGFGELAM